MRKQLSLWQFSLCSVCRRCQQHIAEDITGTNSRDDCPAETGKKQPWKVFQVTGKLCLSQIDGLKCHLKLYFIEILSTYLNTKRHLSASLHRAGCSWCWKPTWCPGKCDFCHPPYPTKVLSPSPRVPGCCTPDPGENGEMEVVSLLPGREWNCTSQQRKQHENKWVSIVTLVIIATEKCNKNMLRISKL